MSAELEGFELGHGGGKTGTGEVGLEMRAVGEILHALDVTIQETAAEPASGETLATVKHGVEFLEDHLRRLYRLEENSGLMEIIVCVHPELAHEIERLGGEHDAIRAEAHRLVQTLEAGAPPSESALRSILAELRRLIAGIVQHEQHERGMLVDSINRDAGGEG